MQAKQVRFETDIKPLFRASDRSAMEWKFDLWSYDDVKKSVQLILRRLAAGEMPCDSHWTPENLALLRRWIESGTPR